MTDSTDNARGPERIWINKVHGQHPEDWDFTDGRHLTKKQLKAKIEYIRADLAPDPLADPRVVALRDENERLRYVLSGVRGAIKTGRNEPLVIWAEQIDIALAALSPTGGNADAR